MISEPTKQIVDAAAIGTGLASLIGWLPAVAAGLTVVWTTIRIYETKTVQRWLRRKTGGGGTDPY